MEYAGFHLNKVLSIIRQVSKELWTGRKVLYDFTDHGIGHSERVLNIFTQLSKLLPKKNALSELEKFSASAAAYLHDIGMQWQEICLGDAAKQKAKESWETVRLKHVSRSLKLLDHITNYKPLNIAECDFPPLMANFGQKHGDLERLLNIIKPIIASHSKAENGTEKGWVEILDWKDWPGTIKFRGRLVCSLFRLADELDVNFERVPDYERLRKAALSPDSLKYWIACSFIEKVEIEKSVFSLLINKSKFPPDLVFWQLSQVLIDDIFNKIKNSFVHPISKASKVTIKDILSEYGLPLYFRENIYIGGKPSGERNLKSLHNILETLKTKLFVDVSYDVYEIRGNRHWHSKPPVQKSQLVREVYLVSQVGKSGFPEIMKKRVARKLYSDGCQLEVTFLSDNNHYRINESRPSKTFKITSVSQSGNIMRLPIGSCMASTEYLKDLKEISFFSGNQNDSQIVNGLLLPDGGIRVELAVSGKLKNLRSRDLRIRKAVNGWKSIDFESPLEYDDSSALIRGYFCDIQGLQLIIPVWDNQHVPGIANFFNYYEGDRFIDVWNSRAKILAKLEKHFELSQKKINFTTISILGYSDRFVCMTHSTERQSIVSFSGATIMSSGKFVLNKREELDKKFFYLNPSENVIEIASWYNQSELFLVKVIGNTVNLEGRVIHSREVKLKKET